jgi:hypothetical protein
MKLFILMAAVLLLSSTAGKAQINNVQTETVYDNSGIRETTIEKNANKIRLTKADWNEETKVATIQNQTNHQYGGMANAPQEINQLTAVFESYFSLKDALVKTDVTIASAKAKDLQTAINTVKMEKLPMDVHTVWMKVLNDLKEDAEHINGTKEIGKQRQHFMGLSKNMYEVIKIAKPTETVYYQFCPMANAGKGANWLSKESAIKNPYYGSQMLTCGKTIETIKK